MWHAHPTKTKAHRENATDDDGGGIGVYKSISSLMGSWLFVALVTSSKLKFHSHANPTKRYFVSHFLFA